MTTNPSAPADVLILGIGNILLRDEGVGVRVVEAMAGLEAHRLPEGVEVVDGGTGGADWVDLIADRAKVVVIDAMDAGQPAGTVLRMSIDDLAAAATPAVSLHEVGLLETVAMAGRLGCAPADVIIIGIQPGDISTGLDLSPPVAAAVPKVIDLVLAEVCG